MSYKKIAHFEFDIISKKAKNISDIKKKQLGEHFLLINW